MRFGLVAALWSISLSVLLFATALWCTRINERLNALLETEQMPEAEGGSSLPEGIESGLKILRIAQHSPLRGHVNEKAIIVAINGEMPSTAAEANELMVEGVNDIEWMGPNGKVLTSKVECDGGDIMAQFEQITPPKRR
ncbi:hypothetical protein [Aidingimonas lacisalsi]|uniref:hypothetical protein n=1 Tax=Aidingimonas lacisalsi TaxID=2604086 RepID=UPI0011D2746F|nr:hypothetical protein [Aidingimonas lacisalsi]